MEQTATTHGISDDTRVRIDLSDITFSIRPVSAFLALRTPDQ